MSQVEIDGVIYEVTKMRRVLDQGHVARKILPIARGIAGGFLQLQRDALARPNGAATPAEGADAPERPGGAGEEGPDDDPAETIRSEERLLGLFGPLADKLAEMPKADFEDVVMLCMGCVYRVDPASGSRSPMVGASGQLMFEAELDLTSLIRLTVEAIQVNLGPSLRGGLRRTMAAAEGMSRSTLSR
jgi:hypothetical protein